MATRALQDAPSVPPEIRAKIDEMVRRIVESFHPEKIILFGSYARGDTNVDSDVDLLVVLRGISSKRDERIRIRIALRGLGIAKDVVVATPEEFEAHKNLVGTIIYPAFHEGKVLYERIA
jgi:predicted nucleotidyltransferase